MNIVKRIGNLLGFNSGHEVYQATAQRNMPIVLVGSVIVLLFACMLAFSLLTDTVISVDGFYEISHASARATLSYGIATAVMVVLLGASFAFALLYLRRKWDHPHLAAVTTMVFALTAAAVWGMAGTGRSPESQIIIFASIQFLVAGLIMLGPLESLLYFAIAFTAFGMKLHAGGELVNHAAIDLAYLCCLDIVVSWIVYGLFRRTVSRSAAIADMSRRDELTGAKNRHYLRDDFPAFAGKEMFVMFCDIDDFKQYNDGFGHDVGDMLLKEFYYALRDSYGDECVYRYGGDEFLVVTPEFNEADFVSKAEKCARQIASAQVAGEAANLTFSGGYVYGTPHDTADFRDMLHTADKHLLDTKQKGKASVHGALFIAHARPESAG